MVAALWLLISACGTSADCMTDSCRAERVEQLIRTDFDAAMAELAAIRDPLVVTAVTMKLLQEWDLGMNEAQGNQMCETVEWAMKNGVCMRRFGRPHLNGPTP